MYAELLSVLARAANIANDRPLGIKTLTNEDYAPVMASQLLIGRTSTIPPIDYENEDEESLTRRGKYRAELLQVWWQQYHEQVFHSLLPFQSLKTAKRHKNLQVGDVCLVKYENKSKANYRLCKVLAVYPDDSGTVRSVQIAIPARDKRAHLLPYHPKEPLVMDTGVQRLVLLCPVEAVN